MDLEVRGGDEEWRVVSLAMRALAIGVEVVATVEEGLYLQSTIIGKGYQLDDKGLKGCQVGVEDRRGHWQRSLMESKPIKLPKKIKSYQQAEGENKRRRRREHRGEGVVSSSLLFRCQFVR